MSTHWSKTPEGRAKISKAVKMAWKKRKAKKRQSMADKAVKAAVRNGKPKAAKAPRMDVRVLSVDPDGNLQRESATLRTWGELVDLMHLRYEGVVVEEVRVEVRR